MMGEVGVNGAQSLIESLVKAGVDVCFANPGTSEMHLVQAIDATPAMRPVLCLFEGVCSGAADGYGRMRGAPATTLLHLGAGLGNAVANLHNARRAGTPVLNLVGDHAIHHVAYDAPLTSDIEGVAKPVSAWIRTANSAEGLAADGLAAVQASLAANPNPQGGVATLIVPADCAWGDGGDVQATPVTRQLLPPSAGAIAKSAKLLGPKTLLLLDGLVLASERGIELAGCIAAKTGAQVFSSTFPARVESGAGRFPINKMPYFPEHVMATMKNFDALVLVGAQAPVSFFAYPDTPSDLVPQGMPVQRLVHRHEDAVAALEALAKAVGAPEQPAVVNPLARPALPQGKLTTGAIAEIVAATAPEDCIISTDSGGGGAAYPVMQQSVPHTWLNLTGGSIGQGGPVAVGAALACPDRRVYALLGDGGAMYTNAFLWTAAREQLDITVVIYANGSYNILEVEYRRLGVNEVGERAGSMFDLTGPDIDWVGLAAAQGVPGSKASTCEEFAAALAQADEVRGPFLIEAEVTARQ
jgi:acetolactate synthase-1/2/3 large subunit